MSLDLAPYLDAIEAELQQAVQGPAALRAPLSDMMRYHLGWALPDGGRTAHGQRGKRLRPLLCLLACQAVGGDWTRATPAAAAVELIHNFTLIHDDIQDDSPTRHGRPTVWQVWGLAQGINAGDAMWALARLAVYRLTAQGYPQSVVLDVGRRLDESCLALCMGQHLDISFEGRLDVTVEAYGEMISGKTAALLSAATAIGALLGNASEPTIEAWAQFGRALGLAFQMTDDILGIWGDSGVTGKSASSDILTRKMTLPVIHALEWERQRGESRLRELYANPESTDQALAGILSRLEVAGSQAYVRRQAEAHQREMLAALRSLTLDNDAAQGLERLAFGIVGRER